MRLGCRDVTVLGDVVEIESRELTDGLNGSCEGKTRVKDEFTVFG